MIINCEQVEAVHSAGGDWHDVPDFWMYEVTKLGGFAIKRHSVLLFPGVHRREKIREYPQKILVPEYPHHPLYSRPQVSLTRIKGHWQGQLAVVVLETFVGPPGFNMWACHNNGLCGDNRLDNLRWDTPEANGEDRWFHAKNGRVPSPRSLSNGAVG